MNDPMDTATATDRPEIARISPELALVDPELAHRVRHRIPRKRLARRRPPLPVLRLPSSAAAAAEPGEHPPAP